MGSTSSRLWPGTRSRRSDVASFLTTRRRSWMASLHWRRACTAMLELREAALCCLPFYFEIAVLAIIYFLAPARFTPLPVNWPHGPAHPLQHAPASPSWLVDRGSAFRNREILDPMLIAIRNASGRRETSALTHVGRRHPLPVVLAKLRPASLRGLSDLLGEGLSVLVLSRASFEVRSVSSSVRSSTSGRAPDRDQHRCRPPRGEPTDLATFPRSASDTKDL